MLIGRQGGGIILSDLTYDLPQRRGLGSRPAMLCAGAIVAAGALVYLNSFAGVFVYDDLSQIVESERVRSVAGVWGNRPLVALTLAANYRLGGLTTWGYHLVNLVIHLLAALALFGLVRRTMTLPRFEERFTKSAHWYAGAAALIWVVHPLQTESVTYVIQRAESLMGLFYLLTLYCLARGATSTRPRAWQVAAVGACLLGMASKPVMITAPIVAFLYDRVFLAESVKDVARRRWALYAGLCATWLVVVATGTAARVLDHDPAAPTTAGFGYDGASPLAYALTQPGVIVHYLGLALWPRSLCLDYNWPLASVLQALAPGLLLVGLLGACVWCFRSRPWLGFTGLSFFVILAPTSSIVPFAHPAFEHRMYLPLAAVAVTLVVAAAALLGRWHRRLDVAPRLAGGINAAILGVVVAALGLVTVDRNRDYHSAMAMWENVLIQRPRNARAYNEIANLLVDAGRPDTAVALYRQAVTLSPGDHLAHDNLANALLRLGDTEAALVHAARAVSLRPDNHRARCTLGNVLIERGNFTEGLEHLRAAVRLRPRDPWSHSNLGRGLALLAERQGNPVPEEAVAHLVEAIRLQPGLAQPTAYLGHVLARGDDIDAVLARYREVDLRRAQVLAWEMRGEQSCREGRYEQAQDSFRRALALDPSDQKLRARLETVNGLTSAATAEQ